MAPGTHHGGYPIRHFVCNYMHNSKTKGYIRMFCLSNGCSTLRDIYSFGQSCMQNTIGELWIQTHIVTTFPYYILFVLTLITRKVQVICRRSAYQMTALLSEMFIFCVRVGWEIRMVNYASKHTLQSLFDKAFSAYTVYLDT